MAKLVVQIHAFDAPASGRFAQARLDLLPELPNASIARERDRAALHELRPRVLLRVVGGGAHQPAVELAGAHQVIEHLGRDLAGV